MSVISTRNFCQFWPVSWTNHPFVVPKRFPRLTNPRVRLRVGHQHSQFWPILARFMDCYSLIWGPGVISIFNEQRVRLHVGHQHSRFLLMWPVSWTITHRFGVPKQFPWLLNPQGVLTCRSSTIAVLADSGSFLGLLLTVLWSRSDFHSC